MPAFRPLAFPSTRVEALAQAHHFAPQMGAEYANHRNAVVPGHPSVSRLSPALRVRLVSEFEVAQIALTEFTELWHCEKFVREVFWRTYWRSWLELRPGVWQNYRNTLHSARHHLDKHTLQRVDALESGESGVAPIDEFARELVATGYMHNHARMWFAAYWVHGEGLPWELGADFFERHLICACPASNTLSWRWVAGLHTPGKTYLARRSNLEKYCDAAYLGDSADLARLEAPEPAPLPDEVVPEPVAPVYALELAPTQDRVGLWITEDDMTPETSVLGEANIASICASVVGAPPLSESSNGKRRDYRLRAVRDAAERASAHWNREAHPLEARDGDDLAEQLIAWAKNHKIDTVVALKPFIGATDDALPHVQTSLHHEGIGLHLVRRAQDAEVLPFAKRGYFHFWEMCKQHTLEQA